MSDKETDHIEIAEEALFKNEQWVISMLQVLSLTSLLIIGAQYYNLTFIIGFGLYGKLGILVVITLFTISFLYALKATYCKHEYKKFNIESDRAMSKVLDAVEQISDKDSSSATTPELAELQAKIKQIKDTVTSAGNSAIENRTDMRNRMNRSRRFLQAGYVLLLLLFWAAFLQQNWPGAKSKFAFSPSQGSGLTQLWSDSPRA